MRLLRALLCAACLLIVTPITGAMAQGQQGSSDIPVFRSTSSLVFLDVTVLDKSGRPVVKGLTKDDFTITEDKKPQRIFSFEAPETHTMGANPGDANPEGKAPVTIFVLDLLNSSFEDFAYIRYSVRRYLNAQPAQLDSPAELMVIGNRSLETLQGYTRNKEDLLFALNHLPGALPYKMMNGSFFVERFEQSIDALQQIALQNKGIPGRKNIVWVGHGGPSLNTGFLTSSAVDHIDRYVHETTNMLIDSRMSLFVIYPGLKVETRSVSISAMDANADIGNGDPFAGDVNFGVFVNETGGNLFYNRNDVDSEMKRSQQLGSEYYTLTYQPHDGDQNGKFRRIRVTLRDKNLRVVTKAGYFAPDEKAPVDPRHKTMLDISEAVRSVIPFTALDMRLSNVVRHPDARSAEFTVLLKWKNLDWQSTDDGNSTAKLILAATSLTGERNIIASRMENLTLTAATQDPARLAEGMTRFPLTIPIPRKTQTVRVAMETGDGGRIGAADLDRKTIDAAPAMPTPDPQLTTHRPHSSPPAP
jgi:VWFA-related protein